MMVMYDHTRPVAKQRVAFMLEPRQVEGLHAVDQATGVNASEQIRRAVDAWLSTSPVGRKYVGSKNSERSRARTRKRS
jgi:hypothetical protein